jgi:hypothetical protein
MMKFLAYTVQLNIFGVLGSNLNTRPSNFGWWQSNFDANITILMRDKETLTPNSAILTAIFSFFPCPFFSCPFLP